MMKGGFTVQLIKLSSNKPSFHTINFKTGFNLVVGSQQHPEITDIKKTRNGVGKSLMVSLIHFCLASSSIKDFEVKLPGWVFNLEFMVDDERFVSSRSTKDQKIITVNDENMNLDEFRKRFGQRIFGLNDQIKYVTFRSLLARFIRPKKSSYINFYSPIAEETEYSRLINTAYLLGISIELIQNKMMLKTDLDKIRKLKDSIENDDILKEYFTGGQDVSIGIIDLNEKIEALSEKIISFQIAENYQQIQYEADNISYDLKKLENALYSIRQSIDNISKSLEIKPDVELERVMIAYQEANIIIPDQVVNDIKKVLEFQSQLISSRNDRLKLEYNQMQEELKKITTIRKEKEKALDDHMRFLGSYGALDHYMLLRDQLESFKRQLLKLQEYEKIIDEYENKQLKVKIDMAKQNIETNEYLVSIRSHLDKIITTFRSLSKEFYSDKPGGIEIKSNENENQLRFDIKARIQDDSADGINEVKLFCYDLTLLLLSLRHKMRLLIHDSRLYSDMDERQRVTLFRLANKYCSENGLQYIASANTDLLDPIKQYYTESEYDEIIDKNIILTLTDESEKTKLLGIEVDLNYENEKTVS